MSNAGTSTGETGEIGDEERVPLERLARGDRVQAVNLTRAVTLAHRLMLALTPWTRLSGLLGRPPLRPGDGMLLRPCSAVHSWMMRYALDIVFLDRSGRVVAVRAELQPWSMTRWQHEALAVLELPLGALQQSNTAVGDQVVFVRAQ